MTDLLHNVIGKGDVILKGIPWTWVAAGCLLGLVIVALCAGFQVGTSRRSTRLLSAALRFIAFALVFLVLAEPVLRSRELIPQQTFLAHAFDVSGSMGIQDYGTLSRAQALQSKATGDAAVRSELDRLFRPVELVFDEHARVRKAREPLTPTDKGTDLAESLRSLAANLNGLPTTGIVLYSDGNPTLHASRSEILESAARLQIPVYTVGAAPPTPGADFWIEKVLHPEEVLRGVDSEITVLVGARGKRGEEVTVTLNGGEVPRFQTLTPRNDNQVLRAQFSIRPAAEGLHHYSVSVESRSAESYPWNNEEQFFIQVRGNKRRLLYVEGSPRYEYRFLRAAFEEDERFQVTSIIQVTENGRFYRQGIDSPDELKDGFPTTREELFQYDVLVIGDVAPAFFSSEQWNLIREFVGEQGGGLLYLAGARSTSLDSIASTPLADLLPARFAPRPDLQRGQQVRPTARGIELSMFGPYDPVRDLSPPWALLPPLPGLYSLTQLKPGAIALVEIADGGDPAAPVVAFQRYGRGVTLLCGISATWPWKFQMPSDNPSYSAFWKQMSLLLASERRNQISVDAFPRIAQANGEVKIRGAALDVESRPDPSAKVELTITAPDGSEERLTPNATIEEGFTFERAFSASEPGVYKVTATLADASDPEDATAQTAFLVKSEPPEFKEVRLNDSLLEEIAKSTGGAYLSLEDIDHLPGVIVPKEGSLQKLHEKTLWDRPGILLILLTCLLLEWLIRRAGNLA